MRVYERIPGGRQGPLTCQDQFPRGERAVALRRGEAWGRAHSDKVTLFALFRQERLPHMRGKLDLRRVFRNTAPAIGTCAKPTDGLAPSPLLLGAGTGSRTWNHEADSDLAFRRLSASQAASFCDCS